MESIELQELGNEILDAFHDLSGSQDIASHSVGKRLISNEQRFRLWAHSLGLQNQGHSSLDYRVRDAVVIKSRLADILAELKEHLENLVSVHRGERQPFEIATAGAASPDDGASDRDSDARSTASTSTSPSLSSGETSFHEVDFRMESVAETLDALYSLATKIKNPRNRPQRSVDELYRHIPAHVRKDFIQDREEAAITIVRWVLRQELSEGLQHEGLKASGMSYDEILEQYASPSNWLVRRTGIANARRKQQFVYWKEHAERISKRPAGNAPPPRPAEIQYNDAPAAEKKQLIQTMQPDLGASSRGSLATSATRFDEASAKLDDLKSVISHQSRVSTVMNLRGDKLEWPSPPGQTTSSGFFTCPYCKIICPPEYLSKEAWYVHLIHDLQPYHCTFEHCNDPNRIYGTRHEWLEHESLHTRVWHCAVHGEEFETQPEYTTHLHEKHPEQGAEHSSPELIAAVVGPSLRLHRDCPFCPTVFSEASALQKHVTFHLERLALLVLPANDEDEIDKSERASDSHEGQRRGRVESIEGDFTDEEQFLFTDIFGSAAPDQPEPKTDMAVIQGAVSRREEESFLSQWLADSEGADADPFQPMGKPPKAQDDPIDVAQVALGRVAEIAIRLGREQQRPMCAELGAELWMVSEHLRVADLDQRSKMRSRISKLLREVEKCCAWPNISTVRVHSRLNSIVQEVPDSTRYNETKSEIENGILHITAGNRKHCGDAILLLRGFAGREKLRQVQFEEVAIRKDAPLNLPGHIHSAIRKTLQKHMCCTCGQGVQPGKHLAELLLQPPSYLETGSSQAEFDLLFSSEPSQNECFSGRWQDVQLKVPRSQKQEGKRVEFTLEEEEPLETFPSDTMREVDEFCKVLRNGLEANSRVCLTIQDESLYNSGFEPLKQKVHAVKGKSLEYILNTYTLTARMKVVLAYILAHSVWLYYDCDWVRTSWNRETIQFMEELKIDDDASQGGDIFVWKPYISVVENGVDVAVADFDDMDGVIHPYPKVRALGIILAEVGKGSPLSDNRDDNSAQVMAAGINDDLLLALSYAKDDRLWANHFEYPSYWQAVAFCLEPKNFHMSGARGDTALQKRRTALWENVVHPLEVLVNAVGWLNNISKIGPLRSHKRRVAARPVPGGDDHSGIPAARFPGRQILSETQKGSRRWLSRMRQLNKELAEVIPSDSATPAKPVRVAVLDTGFDDGGLFFDLPENSKSLDRLKGWKDFVDSSDSWQDAQGHGTHLVSLILSIAPRAELLVARIARNTDDLVGASENVAQAISWATEQRADIISMSFGYADDQPRIREAIRKSRDYRNASIIYLAAASNSGSNDSEAFPARLDSVISMRATNSEGQFQDFNPPRPKRHENAIGTLGCDVPAAWTSDYDGTVKYMSGTSVATAVAAGLAAVLLAYVQDHSTRETFSMVNRHLRMREGMQEMFMELSRESLNERSRYLAPWRIMGISDNERWAIFVGTLSRLH